MSNESRVTKKYSFEAPKNKEEPKVDEPDAEFPSVFSSPVETPAVEVKDPEPELKPKEPPEEKETIIAQPLKTADSIKNEYAKMSEKQYGDTFVQPDGPVIPEKFDLREELAKILVVNNDYDQVRTLVRFDGSDTNYYLLEVHPERLYKAWKLYAEHEGIVPGKFMEMVFDILKIQSQRYFHKVSTVELR